MRSRYPRSRADRPYQRGSGTVVGVADLTGTRPKLSQAALKATKISGTELSEVWPQRLYCGSAALTALGVLAASDRLQVPQPADGDRDRIAVCGLARRLAQRKLYRDRGIHAQRSGARGLRHDRRHGAGADHPRRGRMAPRRSLPRASWLTVMVGSGRPLSRGRVLLRSNDPTAHPRIFPEYFSEPEDL
jgi:hypothetical protein